MKQHTPIQNASNHLRNFNEKMLSDDVKKAYLVLISMPGWDWEAHQKGVITDVRYYDAGGEQPYAFIPNKEHLLFYFRKPATRRDTRTDIEAEVNIAENKAGEWKVRIETPEEAARLAALLAK
jgi:hypothetical protein